MTEVQHERKLKDYQKSVTPINGDATRAFYESLIEEKPDCPMAIRYAVENGLFVSDKHKELVKKYLKLKDEGAFNQRAKALERLTKLESTKKVKTSIKKEDSQ